MDKTEQLIKELQKTNKLLEGIKSFQIADAQLNRLILDEVKKTNIILKDSNRKEIKKPLPEKIKEWLKWQQH